MHTSYKHDPTILVVAQFNLMYDYYNFYIRYTHVFEKFKPTRLHIRWGIIWSDKYFLH